MAERSKAHAWKACEGNTSGGSNPLLSANRNSTRTLAVGCCFFYVGYGLFGVLFADKRVFAVLKVPKYDGSVVGHINAINQLVNHALLVGFVVGVAVGELRDESKDFFVGRRVAALDFNLDALFLSFCPCELYLAYITPFSISIVFYAPFPADRMSTPQSFNLP